MKDASINGTAGLGPEEARARIEDGIIRARKLAAEAKRMLERLNYGRLGPRPNPDPSFERGGVSDRRNK